MLSIELKILICFCMGIYCFLVTALIIGVERKSLWFQRRTKYSWFNRRGFLGEALLLDIPKREKGMGLLF